MVYPISDKDDTPWMCDASFSIIQQILQIHLIPFADNASVSCKKNWFFMSCWIARHVDRGAKDCDPRQPSAAGWENPNPASSVVGKI